MIKKAYADTSAGQCHYRFTEGNGLPIIFLHQTPSSSLMFEAMMKQLSGMNMYAIDTPGFGQSFDPIGTPKIGDYARWIIEVIDFLNLDQFHLFGHHTGSSLATQITLERPNNVMSLSMIGPFFADEEEKIELLKNMNTDWSPDENGDFLNTVWHLTGEVLGATGNLALQHRETLDALRAHYSSHQSHHAIWDQDLINSFKSIKCPCLVMCSKDDVMYPFFKKTKLIKSDSTTHEIKGKNLGPDLDTEAIANKFKSFINTIEIL